MRMRALNPNELNELLSAYKINFCLIVGLKYIFFRRNSVISQELHSGKLDNLTEICLGVSSNEIVYIVEY